MRLAAGVLPIVKSSPSSSLRPLRFAVLGAGFAGLSITWNLLKLSPSKANLNIDLFDENGIGGGASGVSGGLVHPYSPKGKILWQGAECWKECLDLLSVAEKAAGSSNDFQENDQLIVHRRGILRSPCNIKTFDAVNDNAANFHPTCRIIPINQEMANELIPNIQIPFSVSFFIPQAVTVDPQMYLKALFCACEDLVHQSLSSEGKKKLNFKKAAVQSLLEFQDYDAVIVCLGAKANSLPEFNGKLPLRTCRGLIAHLESPDGGGLDHAPSLLSDAWLAVRGQKSLHLGSTWDWNSGDSSSFVTDEEASKALEELVPKMCRVHPKVKDFILRKVVGGLRAMPPVTPRGSLPLLGCVDGLLGGRSDAKTWVFCGLGSRGLLYHARLGRLLAQAVLSRDELIIPSDFTSWKMKLMVTF